MSHARRPDLEIDPQDPLTHERLLGLARPWIESLRRAIFGSERVPFPTLRESVAWVEKARGEKLPSFKRMTQIGQMLEREPGVFGQITFGNAFLPYRKPRGREVFTIATARKSPHFKLNDTAERISKATGWETVDIVMWTLAGTEPSPAPRFKLHLRYWPAVPPLLFPGPKWHRKTMVIEVYDPSLTDAEWRQIRKQVREEFERYRQRSLSERDHILHDVVQAYGQTPGATETWTAHWEAIAKECNRRAKDPKWFSGCRGPYMRWGRLRKKLEEMQRQNWDTETTEPP